MGFGIETVAGILTNAAATGAQAMTAASGQSFTVRAAATNTTPVNLVRVSGEFQDVGEIRIRSPRLHDDVNALRLLSEQTHFGNVLQGPFMQPLYSQDTLIVEAFFEDIATVNHISVAYLTIMYDDVPGIAGNYRSWAEVAPNVKNLLSVPNVLTSSATAGQWGATAAMNATVDVFKANTLYALLGYVSLTAGGAFTIQGVDIGNLQVGGPLTDLADRTRDYFVKLSEQTGRPCIPIINSQNKSTTNLQASDLGASGEFEVSTIWAELAA